jgi:hypothetical protein
MQPPWITPITIGKRGFTFGLVSTELAEFAGGGERLGRRLDTGALVDAGRELGRMSGVEPDETSDAFSILRQWAKTILRPAMREVLSAADDGIAFKPNLTEKQMLRLAKIYAGRVHPVQLALRDGTVTHAQRADTLIGRVALEVGWLLSESPHLRRCPDCDSVVVSGRRKEGCSWALWDADGYLVEPCTPRRETAPLNDADHARERKRLSARVSRAIASAKAVGADVNSDRRVQLARHDYTTYMNDDANKRPRGRPPSRKPQAVEVRT